MRQAIDLALLEPEQAKRRAEDYPEFKTAISKWGQSEWKGRRMKEIKETILLELYRKMKLIRYFEEAILDLYKKALGMG